MKESHPETPETRIAKASHEILTLLDLTLEEQSLRDVAGCMSVHDIDPKATESLNEKRGSQALRAIDVMVCDAITEKLNELDLSEDQAKNIIRAVTLKDWSGIEPGTNMHGVLREFIAKANTVNHALVAEWLSRKEKHTGFSEVERLEYIHLLPALEACDRLYIKVATTKQPINSDERAKRGFTNPWALTIEKNGEVLEVSFNDIFPEEMGRIRGAFDSLLAQLYQLWSRPPGSLDEVSKAILAPKIAYYEAVDNALKTGDVGDWFSADEKLPQQGGADIVLHIHPIEDGYMQDRIIRAPEISLRAPDLDAQRAADICKQTQERMITSLRDGGFDSLSSLVASIDLVTRSSATPRHFLGSGMEIDLAPAGQILPNDLNARINGGVDTSLDRQSAEERYDLLKRSFEAVFGVGAHDIHIGKTDFDDIVGGDVASHEFGHPVGLMPDLFDRIDKTLLSPFIEEWKSTAGGLVLGYWLPYKRNEVDMNALSNKLLRQVMIATRYSAARSHSHAKAYYRHSVMLMNTAERAGILQKAERDNTQPWTIDVSDEKVIKFYEFLEEEYRAVLEIYAIGSTESLRDFLQEKLHTTECIDFIASRIDALVGQADVETPTECLTLPATVGQ
jgi:hypothetical protein